MKEINSDIYECTNCKKTEEIWRVNRSGVTTGDSTFC
jgi:hypothetical protein